MWSILNNNTNLTFEKQYVECNTSQCMGLMTFAVLLQLSAIHSFLELLPFLLVKTEREVNFLKVMDSSEIVPLRLEVIVLNERKKLIIYLACSRVHI